MDNPKKELDPQGADENSKRMGFAKDAVDWVRRRIDQEKDFTPELARKLGVLYVAYFWQWWSFAEDHLDSTGDREILDVETGRYSIDDREIRIHRLRGLEKILFDAQHGDYRMMKTFFETTSNGAIKKLGQALKEESLPAKLPAPVWKDPRFNPSASPLPPDLQDRTSDPTGHEAS